MTSELLFEELDCGRKRGLRDMALSRRLREAQMFAHREKIPDLVHFHASSCRTQAVTISFGAP
jgi:hypothetical protein